MPSRRLVHSVPEKRRLSEMISHTELLIDFGGTVAPSRWTQSTAAYLKERLTCI